MDYRKPIPDSARIVPHSLRAHELEATDDSFSWSAKTFPLDLQQKYLELIRMGISKKQAAKECGISTNVIYNFRKQNPTYGDQIEEAEFEACDLVEDALMQKILIDRDRTAMIFWLVNRSNGRWKDIRQITMTTPEDSNAQKAVVHDILHRLETERKENEKS